MRKALFCILGYAACMVAGSELRAQTPRLTGIQQHYEKAQTALAAGQTELAASEFREILRLDPQNASAHANLGIVAFRQKDYAQAAQEFRAALKLQPGLANAKAFLGMSELRLGHSAAAAPLLQESFEHLLDNHIKREVGMDLISLDYQSARLDRSVDVLRVLEGMEPAAPDVLFTAYRTYSDLAARSLSALAQSAPDSPEMHEILARAAASQDDFSGAISQYRKALEMNPNLSGVHYELGQMILASSQAEPALADAENEFKQSLAGDSASPQSEYMLGEIAWLRSKPEEGLEHDQRALSLQPGFVDAHIAAGKTLTRLGRPREALSHLEEAVRLDPRNEVAHYRLAQAYRQLGRTAEAAREEEAFRKLRSAQEPLRALYQQVQERSVVHQSIAPTEPQ